MSELSNFLLEESPGAGPEIHLEARRKRERRHSHYFKACPYSEVDVYRVLELFSVTDPCIQHALKKLLVAGGRGHKDVGKDIQEAVDTLQRWQEMRAEEEIGET